MASQEIRLDRASFAGLVLETLSYGALSVLFIATLWVLYKRRGIADRSTQILLLTSISLWVLTTAHWIIVVVRGSIAFVDRQDVVDGALAYYADLTLDLYAAKTAVYVALTFVGDSFVTYRCWVVWHKKLVVVICPIILVFATATVGFIATHKFTVLQPGNEIFLPELVPWVTSFIILTLVTNVTCTLLIAFQIIRSQRQVKLYGQGNHLIPVLVVVIESAAIYSAVLTSLVTVYLLNSNAQYLILDFSTTVVGITFHLIILHVSIGKELSNFSGFYPAQNSRSQRFPMNARPVAVNVSRLVEMGADGGHVADKTNSGDSVKPEFDLSP